MPTANDLTIYERHAAGWWDEKDRTFRSLRSVTKYRLRLLQTWIGAVQGLCIADLGCGGGLLSVPLARQGAIVLGIDLSAASIEEARRRASHDCTFLCSDLHSTPCRDGAMDVVLLADVLEHVPDPRAALREGARILKPGGLLYVNTINRTRRAHLLAVTLGEGLGFIPRGTHDSALFVRPDELEAGASAFGLVRERVQGEAPRVVSTLAHRAIQLRSTRSTAVAYSALYRKRGGCAR